MGKSLIIKGADFSANAIDREDPSISVSSLGIVTVSAPGAIHVYYTVNGEIPTESSTEYTQPFQTVSGVTIKVIAKYSDNTMSDVVSVNSGDLIIEWNKTSDGYIDGNGNIATDNSYQSMLVPMVNGIAYEVHQQMPANKVRVFSVSGTTYTAINFVDGSVVTINCNNDNYVLQCVFKVDDATHPNPPYVKLVAQTE